MSKAFIQPRTAESASVVRIGSLGNVNESRRVRIAGRVIFYDFMSSHLLLASKTHAVWVDVTLTVDPFDPESTRFTRLSETKTTVMVIGDLCSSKRDLPSHSDLERLGVHGGLHRGLYIEAILARNDDFLDLDDWERTVAQREELERASGGGG